MKRASTVFTDTSASDEQDEAGTPGRSQKDYRKSKSPRQELASEIIQGAQTRAKIIINSSKAEAKKIVLKATLRYNDSISIINTEQLYARNEMRALHTQKEELVATVSLLQNKERQISTNIVILQQEARQMAVGRDPPREQVVYPQFPDSGWI